MKAPSPASCDYAGRCGWVRYTLPPLLQGNPPSLRFGHPDVASGGYSYPALRLGARARRRAVFSGSALRVSHGRSPQRSKERAERPGDGCPCVGAEETCGVPSQPARRGRTPPLRAPKHCQGEPVHLPAATSGYPLGCSPQRSKERAERPRGWVPLQERRKGIAYPPTPSCIVT